MVREKQEIEEVSNEGKEETREKEIDIESTKVTEIKEIQDDLSTNQKDLTDSSVFNLKNQNI